MSSHVNDLTDRFECTPFKIGCQTKPFSELQKVLFRKPA